MFKGTRLYSILFNKCPRCQKGDFFVAPSAFNLLTFDKMYTHCSSCTLNYEPEPGFYMGSMYVSYAFYVAWIVTMFVLFVVLLNVDVLDWLWGLIPSLFLLTPFFFRVARRVWASLFIS